MHIRMPEVRKINKSRSASVTRIEAGSVTGKYKLAAALLMLA